MFGATLRIKQDGKEVVLRQPNLDELKYLVIASRDFQVRQYLNNINVPTLKSEEIWYESLSENKEEIAWGIEYNGTLAGITSIGCLTNQFGCGTSGIMIFGPRGEGVGSLAHIGRTWYASEVLNLRTVVSHVWSPNEASKKALLRVGYIITGSERRVRYFNGNWIDKLLFTWTNPRYANEMYSGEIPEDTQKGIELAQRTLDLAKEVVTY